MEPPPSTVDAVRHFSRFYTRTIGLLEEALLHSPFTLTEARVIWELARRGDATATELGADLRLDPGYLSRVLRGLQRRRVVVRTRAPEDARVFRLTLTPSGQEAFAELDAASRRQIDGLIAHLGEEERTELTGALSRVERLLEPPPERAVPYLLRPPRAGDLGWVVQRHGRLYAEEYGWDEDFEALVATIVADFVREQDPKRARCWIAEREGRNVGCVFVVEKSRRVAQLRCLLVEPSARGFGIGRRLVEECVRFAKERGYHRMILWTNDVLHAARRIYEAEGFTLAEEERHHSFGHDLVGQIWEREL